MPLRIYDEMQPNLENLKNAREDKGYTIKYMAEKCNVTSPTYRSWEKGNTTIPLDKAKIIANMFDTTVSKLFYSRVYRVI